MFGSRHPDQGPPGLAAGGAVVASVADAIAGADIAILALPGAAVTELVAEHGAALEGKIVIDATNQMGVPVANCRAALPAGVRYARAFNTLGGENMADPQFADGPADMFFSSAEEDEEVVAGVVRGVGLRRCMWVGTKRSSSTLCSDCGSLWPSLKSEAGAWPSRSCRTSDQQGTAGTAGHLLRTCRRRHLAVRITGDRKSGPRQPRARRRSAHPACVGVSEL